MKWQRLRTYVKFGMLNSSKRRQFSKREEPVILSSEARWRRRPFFERRLEGKVPESDLARINESAGSISVRLCAIYLHAGFAFMFSS